MSTGRSQRSRDTGIEVSVRVALRAIGLGGYRLQHRIELPKWGNRRQHTTPDIAYPSKMLAIFADGDFWHTCPRHGVVDPKTNSRVWRQKRAQVRARDQRHSRALVTLGWRVLRVWECESPEAAAKAAKALIDLEAPPAVYGLPEQK